MTTNQWILKLFSAKGLICISLFMAPAAKSQWVANGPPAVLDYQFITTGGITYFRLVGLLPGGWCCQRIAGYGVSREGSALNQIIQHETWTDACVLMVCDPWPEELVSVLGALPPGDYSLTLFAGPGVPSPWAVFPFTVPTNSSPTLSVSTATNTNSPLLLIHVAGVSNVVYELESSADLTNWTALQTNLGAPVTFSASMTNGPKRFYRVSVWSAPAHPPF